ncbi:MAG: hypothetical protein ACKPKO_13110, partial [Candidatus Fonsibacter sp.]
MQQQGYDSDSGSTASDSGFSQSHFGGEGPPLLPMSDAEEEDEAGEARHEPAHPSRVDAPDPPGENGGSVQLGLDVFCISCVNVTSFWTALATLVGMPGAVIAIQEHGIQAQSMGAAQATAHQQGFTLVAGPQDETGHSGVAVLARAPARLQEDACCSIEGLNARDLGRLLVARADLPCGQQ